MLHRAILGSMERFIAILIEHYAGKFPLWLAQLQVVVATVTSEASDYAAQVARTLKDAGLRVETDTRNGREDRLQDPRAFAPKIPVLAVVGKRDAEAGTVVLRRIGSDAQETLGLTDAVVQLAHEARRPGELVT